MNITKSTLRTALKRAGFLALALPLTLTLPNAPLYAQSSSSTYNSGPGYNSQYGTANGPYGNAPNNNRRTPRYTGHSWTDHLVLEGGAGVTAPAGDTQNYANTGFNILAGAGIKFNDRLSVLAEWNFNRLNVPSGLANVAAGTPDGNEHIWTLDLNPKFNFIHTDRGNGYVIGGGGFSRALTNFTVPVVFYCYDYYFGPYPCSGTVTVAHTSSNQGNIDIGVGGEWRLSPYERGKIFIEARWERLFSPDNGLPPGPNANLIPVTIGYRW
ncbi:MAG: hypothetical protein ABI164_08580 [Acidobacteriaceae bacterium]